MSLLLKKRGLKYADNHVYSRLHWTGRELQLSEPEGGGHAGGNAGSSPIRSCCYPSFYQPLKHIDSRQNIKSPTSKILPQFPS